MTADDFAAFYRELWGYEPFPWQRRLAAEVLARGWPPALDLPTAAGKTATLDIALFHLAAQAEAGAERTAPLRIVYVVDRRLIVDQAFLRARELAQRLAAASGGLLGEVAARLRKLSVLGGEPLRVVALRGGMPLEPEWCPDPSQPTVCVSTVDQAGSRLLFRGYGVSPSMLPVHAGLMGADVLFLLDEVHLSQPFAETLDQVRSYGGRGWAHPHARPPQVVHLSATLPVAGDCHDRGAGGLAPGRASSPAFRLDADDERCPELARRLRTPKWTELRRLTASSEDADALAQQIARLAYELARGAEPGPAPLVTAVIVNRVLLARRTHQALTRLVASDAEPQAETVLLIGRARPLDRDGLVQAYLPRLRAQDRQRGERPLFVVATQCVEAGADLDFDLLVTQIAPLDCLRQRFGRLDRVGRWCGARQQARRPVALVVASRDEVRDDGDPDPLYGLAPARTWRWLEQRAAPGQAG
ncbi:MAG: hypothetical protein KatS3mg102_2011 [Planctomycetota bacterium]|nr:MAG: hypothetical protein KatS3mg102_2011 [Planctomycetota bacterium]